MIESSLTADDIARLERTGRRILGELPGVTVSHAGVRTSSQPATLSGRRMHLRREKGATLHVHGWTTSLHGRIIDLPITDVQAPDAEMEAFARMQERRAQEAAKLGAREPFHLFDALRPETQGRQTEIAHLLCDRAGLTVLIEQNGPDKTAAILREAVQDSYAKGKWNPHRLTGRRIRTQVEVGDVTLLESDLIIRRRTLPQTVLLHLKGRRIEEIVDAHPMLAGRVINGVDDVGGETWLRMSPDNVRIREVLPS